MTAVGRRIAQAVQDAIGHAADDLWGNRQVETVPGLTVNRYRCPDLSS